MIGPANGPTARWNLPGPKQVIASSTLITTCKDTCIAVVEIDTATAQLSCDGDIITCDSALASTTVNVLNFSPGEVNITWIGAGIFSGQGAAHARWSEAGEKIVSVEVLRNGCVSSCTTNVAIDTTRPQLACVGDVITCDSTEASTIVSVLNFISGYTIQWSGAGLVGGQGTPHARWNQDGLKTATVRVGETGCVNSCDALVTIDTTRPELTCVGDTLTCDSLVASTRVTVNNFASGYTIEWSGDGLVGGQGTDHARWNVPGTKTATVRVNASGCTSTCDVEVEVNQEPPGCGIIAPETACGNVTVFADPTILFPGALIVWTTLEGCSIVSGQGTAELVVNIPSGQTCRLQLSVTSSATGCFTVCEDTIRCVEAQGCTPGFWKNHTSLWDGPADPTSACVSAAAAASGGSGDGTTSALFRNTFGLTAAQMSAAGLSADLTMEQAINLGGGEFQKLARHAVAGVLSSCALAGYAFSPAQVIALVNTAVATLQAEPAASQLAAANDLPNCPLGSSSATAIQRMNVEESQATEPIPEVFALRGNHPNPFNPSTRIEYDIPERSLVQLTVYNVLGQEVTRLVDDVIEAGYHAVDWNSDRNSNAGVPSGVYIYRMTAASLESGKDFLQVRTMVLLK